MIFDQELISQGFTLTAIGIATAFGLLIVMMILIYIMGWVTGIPERRAAKARMAAEAAAAESRDRALAAVAAVAALSGSVEHTELSAGPTT